MKIDVIKKSYKEKTLIGIRTDMIEWDESIIGFITNINDRSIIINEIDKNGFFIGNTNIEIDRIISIDINDRYQKRLLYLHKNRGLLDYNKRVTIWKEGGKLTEYFLELIKNKKIVTFYLDEDNYVTGILNEFDEFYVMIKTIGKEGDEDGISYYPIESIIGLRYDGIEEQKIKLLNDNCMKFYR